MSYVIGVDVFQRLGLAVVTRFGQKKKKGNMEELGYRDLEVMVGGWVYLAKDLGG